MQQKWRANPFVWHATCFLGSGQLPRRWTTGYLWWGSKHTDTGTKTALPGHLSLEQVVSQWYRKTGAKPATRQVQLIFLLQNVGKCSYSAVVTIGYWPTDSMQWSIYICVRFWIWWKTRLVVSLTWARVLVRLFSFVKYNCSCHTYFQLPPHFKFFVCHAAKIQ